MLTDLSFGTEIEAMGESENGFLPWRLPDGRKAWTALADLASLGIVEESGIKRSALLRRAERLLAVPYEWGGSSSRGLDCSGFVQALLGTLGIGLPRDADLQAACPVLRNLDSSVAWRSGDLVFYGQPGIDHVGILNCVNPLRLIHASGEVKIEDLEPGGGINGRLPVKILTPFPDRV